MSDPKKDDDLLPRTAAAPAPAPQTRPPIDLTRRPHSGHALGTIQSILREEQRENYKLLPELATGLTDAEKQTFLKDRLHTLNSVPGDVPTGPTTR